MTAISSFKENGPKMRIKDRYFLVNGYRSKNGVRYDAFEHATHRNATVAAYFRVRDLIGEAGECDELFAVFVGSANALRRSYDRVNLSLARVRDGELT